MMQSLDFIFSVWKSEALKSKLLANLEEQKEGEIAIGVYALKFDFVSQIVRISCNDPTYLFHCKIIPIEMPFESFVKLIHHNLDFDYKVI